MDRPIVDPPVPYVGAINGGLSPGKMVRIQGIAAPAGNRFDINLQVGPQPQNILALHLSVRLNEGYIARNSCEDGDWGEEEGTGTNPIAAGQRFEIIILVDHSQYKIAVNGQHFGEFRHRIAFTRVTHLAVEGDVTLTLVSWEGSSAPPPQPGIAVPLSHGGNPGDMPPSYNSATGAKAPIGYTPVPQQPLPPVAGPGSRGYQPSGPIPTRRHGSSSPGTTKADCSSEASPGAGCIYPSLPRRPEEPSPKKPHSDSSIPVNPYGFDFIPGHYPHPELSSRERSKLMKRVLKEKKRELKESYKQEKAAVKDVLRRERRERRLVKKAMRHGHKQKSSSSSSSSDDSD